MQEMIIYIDVIKMLAQVSSEDRGLARVLIEIIRQRYAKQVEVG